MVRKLTEANIESIKEINAILSFQDITPYDLLLALGNKDIVPDDVIADRKQRILARGEKESPYGYIKNAMEDLQKLNFERKQEVLDKLGKIVGPKTLSGYETFSGFSAAYWGFGALILAAIIVYYFKQKT
jgi:hypothetical protein